VNFDSGLIPLPNLNELFGEKSKLNELFGQNTNLNEPNIRLWLSADLRSLDLLAEF